MQNFYPNNYNLNQINQPNYMNNIMPRQEVIKVNGKASVDTLRLAPNSSLLALDTTAPIVWLCMSDGIGNVTSTPYDIVEHKQPPKVDMETIEARISRIEQSLDEMRQYNDKSNVAKPNQKQSNSKPHTN